NKIIDRVYPDEIITSVVVLFEVYKKVKRLRGEQVALEDVTVINQTKTVPVDDTLALEAADYGLEYGLHFADALVYATARRFAVELYTSDEHLQGFPHVKFIA